MTSGVPWKMIFRFSIPLFIGLLLQQLYNTVDTIVVGNFASEAALSAVGTTGSLVFSADCFCNKYHTGFIAGSRITYGCHWSGSCN